MKTDFQRSKLYKVERIWWKGYEHNPKDVEFKYPMNKSGGVIVDKPLQDASNYATWIWITFKNKIYGRDWRKRVPKAKVFSSKGWGSMAHNTGGWYNPKKGKTKYVKITLGKGHYRANIIIHEMAHHIAPESEHHGPIFTKIYMYLLAYYLDYDISWMCKTANEHNRQFASEDKYLNQQFFKLMEKQKKDWIENETLRLQGKEVACEYKK